MKLNFHLPLAGICLVSILWLPAAAAPSEAQQLAQIDSAKNRIERTISLLEEQVALSRTMGEFVEEIGLFDNRIYGRVAEKGTLQEAEINSLNSQIEAKNSQLESLQSTAGIDRKVFGDQEGSGETYDLMVKQLEQEIAGLCQHLIQITLPLEGGTELLDGSLLLNEVLPPVEMLDEQTAGRALELQRRQLEQLEREQQKLRKKINTPADSSGKQRKNN